MDARIWIRLLAALRTLRDTRADDFLTIDDITAACGVSQSEIVNYVLDCVRVRLLRVDVEIFRDDRGAVQGFRFGDEAKQFFDLLTA